MDSSKKIVFHHIPKCGGMSIAAGLAMTYFPWTLLTRGRKGFPGHLNAQEASEDAERLGIDRYAYRRQLLEQRLAQDKVGFVFGHYPFSRAVAEKYPDWHYITLMRDPVQRWYSEYFWNRYKDHDYAKTELDIEAYLESEQGLRDTRSYMNFLTDDNDIKTALENLKYFAVIGRLENLSKFQNDLKAALGRKPFFFRRNKSPAKPEDYKKPDEKSDFHKKLLGLLAEDIEIYNCVNFA